MDDFEARMQALRDEFEPQIADLKKQMEEGFAQRDAELAALVQARAQDHIDAALDRSLRSAGVKEGLRAGARALLKTSFEFEVTDSDFEETGHVVQAKSAFGLQSVDGAVAQFLEGEDGAGFRPKSAAPSTGFFSILLEDLKRAR